MNLSAQDYRRLSERSDFLGAVQSCGILGLALATGAATFLSWQSEQWFVALLALVAHGNVCSMFDSGVHELMHKTVFRSRALNARFLRLYVFLSWMGGNKFWETHKAHHANVLHSDDPELGGACRPLWLGTWLWSALFNVPRFVVFASRCQLWIVLLHIGLAVAFISAGVWQLVFIVSLAPFCFGWLQLLVNYPQHAGLKLNSDDPCDSARSMRLPIWLSFLYWRMEYHLEHHLYPAVPCYRLSELRRVLDKELPPRQSLVESWLFILRHRLPGLCGSDRQSCRLAFQRLVQSLRNKT